MADIAGKRLGPRFRGDERIHLCSAPLPMIANLITSVRLVLLVPLFVLASGAEPGMRWAGLGVFLLAGATDVLDGHVARRLGEVSKGGALLDLVADRLLTLVAVTAVAAAGALPGPWLVAGVALVGRDLVVASLNEALPGQLDIRVSPLERVKIALQFAGLGLLITPLAAGHDIGRMALAAAAALAGVAVLDYVRRAIRRIKNMA